MKRTIATLLPLSLLFYSTIASDEDIYRTDAGIVNGKKLWFPEWRMKELLQHQDGRSLDGKVDPFPTVEFYLTDDEIQEVLYRRTAFESLETRIEKVLQRRFYHDYDHDASLESYHEQDDEEVHDESGVQVRKGQQQRPSSRGLRTEKGLFNKDRKRGKRANNGRGKRANSGGGKRGNNGRGKRGGNGKRGKRGNGVARNKRQKRGGNKHQQFKYQNRNYRNICLDPPDRFRTCLSREEDPTNDLQGCDAILRNSYNMGALFLQRGKWPPPSDDPDYIEPHVPYTEPFIKNDEVMTVGFMHLTLLQSTENLNCNERIRVEETVLWYLQQNVGEDDTFYPMCVFLDEDAISEEIVRGADGRVAATTALKVEVVFRTKKKFNNKLEKEARVRRRMMEEKWGNATVPRVRDLQLLDTCNSANHHLCCSQDSINGDQGGFCKSIGCELSDCGRRGLVNLPRPPADVGGSRPGSGGRPGSVSFGSRPQRPNANQQNRPNRPVRPSTRRRNVFDESLDEEGREELEGFEIGNNGHPQSRRNTRRKNERKCEVTGFQNKEFRQVLKQNTIYKNVELALSLLNNTDTSGVASCSVNWYIVNNGGIPSATCDEYSDRDCKNNEDLVYQDDAVRCIEPSAMPSVAPTATPSEVPSSTPSAQPSESSMPTEESTEFPTLSPTEIPTLSSR